MIAEIVAVGTELLLGDIVNTNGAFLSRELAKLGIHVYRHTVVGDNPARLLAAYTRALAEADIVIATGGLGPTEDDITKEVAARYFNLPLVLHEPSWKAIQRHFTCHNAAQTAVHNIAQTAVHNIAQTAVHNVAQTTAHNTAQTATHNAAQPAVHNTAHNAVASNPTIPANNKKQAMLPEGATVLPNANGTAPGLCIEKEGRTLMMLPGPPNELEPMFLQQGVPFLRAKAATGVFLSKTLKITGVGESRAEEILGDLIDAQTNPTIAPYAKTSEVWLRITASAPDEAAARALIAPVAAAVHARLGVHVYGEDDDTLEGVTVGLLAERGLKLACAESCTGGLLAGRLVNVPGVSDVLTEGLVTYSNEAKIRRLGVSEALLAQYGAVSEQTAAAMAEGAARTAGVPVGMATTGIAGPGGGTTQKPVGLVYLGLYIEGTGVYTKELRLSGDRAKIRHRAVVGALDFLRERIIAQPIRTYEERGY